MTKKPTSLAAVMAKKTPPAADPAPEPASSGKTRTLTLRLPEMVHDQLREMAFTARRPQHAFLMEALNLLFEKHGRPPIAPSDAS